MATTPRRSDPDYKERWNESREPPIFRRKITADEIKAFKAALIQSYKLTKEEEYLIRHEFRNIKIVRDDDISDAYKFTDRKKRDQDNERSRRGINDTDDIDFMWLVFQMFVERAHEPDKPAVQEWRDIYKVKVPMPDSAKSRVIALQQQRSAMQNIMGTMSLNPGDAFSGFQGSNQSVSNHNAAACGSNPYARDSSYGVTVTEITTQSEMLALPAPMEKNVTTAMEKNVTTAMERNVTTAMEKNITMAVADTEMPKPIMRTGVKAAKGRVTIN